MGILYEKIVKRQEKNAAKLGEKNFDIFKKRLTDPNKKWKKHLQPPYSMYFYYIRINSDGGLVVDHYFYVDGDINDPKTWNEISYDKTNLTNIVTRLVKNARPSGSQDNPPILTMERNFQNIKWQHKSCIAIYMDEAKWLFRKKTSGDSAVVFVVKEGVKKGTPNHSFFDAIDLSIHPDGASGPERSAIVFMNHMKANKDGADLQETERFEFKLLFDVQFASGGDAPMVVILDPGGETQGPSVPPPPAIQPPPPPRKGRRS